MNTVTDYFTYLEQSDFTFLYPDARAVLDFWFNTENAPFWFVANDDFDKKIYDKFGALWQAVCQGERAHWRRDEQQKDDSKANLAGRLAEIIVLDQFSRNLCRGQATAFAHDGMALVLAQEAIEQPDFDTLPVQWRKFMMMPMMHSESLAIHEHYLPLFEQLNDPNTLDFEHQHLAIIERFGRYPHRNKVLNRTSTDDEKVFLAQPKSSF